MNKDLFKAFIFRGLIGIIGAALVVGYNVANHRIDPKRLNFQGLGLTSHAKPEETADAYWLTEADYAFLCHTQGQPPHPQSQVKVPSGIIVHYNITKEDTGVRTKSGKPIFGDVYTPAKKLKVIR